MEKKQIKIYGDPVLRKKAYEINEITPEIKTLISDMTRIMLQAPGIGLAAPQVGVSKRLIIVTFGLDEDRPHPRPLINPEILWHSDQKEEMEEGCLSLPGITGDVARWTDLVVCATDSNGIRSEFDVHGITARIIQHEMDHLDGVLFIDRITLKRQDVIKRRLDRQQTKTQALV